MRRKNAKLQSNNALAIFFKLLFHNQAGKRSTFRTAGYLLTKTAVNSLLVQIFCIATQLQCMFRNLFVCQIRSHDKHGVLAFHSFAFAIR